MHCIVVPCGSSHLLSGKASSAAPTDPCMLSLSPRSVSGFRLLLAEHHLRLFAQYDVRLDSYRDFVADWSVAGLRLVCCHLRHNVCEAIGRLRLSSVPCDFILSAKMSLSPHVPGIPHFPPPLCVKGVRFWARLRHLADFGLLARAPPAHADHTPVRPLGCQGAVPSGWWRDSLRGAAPSVKHFDRWRAVARR